MRELVIQVVELPVGERVLVQHVQRPPRALGAGVTLESDFSIAGAAAASARPNRVCVTMLVEGRAEQA